MMAQGDQRTGGELSYIVFDRREKKGSRLLEPATWTSTIRICAPALTQIGKEWSFFKGTV